MNENLIALILSKNLANRNYNYIVKDLLKSNNYSVGIICNLLYNPHINREAIKMTLDSINEIGIQNLTQAIIQTLGVFKNTSKALDTKQHHRRMDNFI